MKALDSVLGVKPAGYRAPAWDLTPLTLDLVRQHGMIYSSNLMDDVFPYVHPTTGVVELPVRLDWSEQGHYDLTDARQRNLMYDRVIRESMRIEDLRVSLHGPTLSQVWRQLWLPRKVRELWESRFQSLARAA